MKNKWLPILIVTFFLGMTACKSTQKTTGDNSMTSVDWPGTYQGILPCADCSGIQTQIILNENLTYEMETRYMDKKDTIFNTSGKFNWDKSGSIISFDNETRQRYQVGENRLFQLDKKGKRITGDLANKYILEKAKMEIAGKYWKLIWLNGQSVKSETREPFISLNDVDKSVKGNSSCNLFHGTYELLEGGNIKFSPFMMTKMACVGNKTEGEFMQVFDKTKSYSMTETELIFKDENKNSLAKFEADFFK